MLPLFNFFEAYLNAAIFKSCDFSGVRWHSGDEGYLSTNKTGSRSLGKDTCTASDVISWRKNFNFQITFHKHMLPTRGGSRKFHDCRT